MKTVLDHALEFMFPKPSKILRLAKFNHKQAFGCLHSSDSDGEYYCAEGAILAGYGWDGKADVTDEMKRTLKNLNDLFTEQYGQPMHYYNDMKHKSFDWFADKLEGIGY